MACIVFVAACGGGSDGTHVPTTQIVVTPALSSTWAGGPSISLNATKNGGDEIKWSIQAGGGSLSGSGDNVTYIPAAQGTEPNSEAVIAATSGSVQATALVYLNFRSTSSFDFNNQGGIVEDTSGNVYVSDTGNNVIRIITKAGNVQTFSGNGTAALADGPAGGASFNHPGGLAFVNGNLIVADMANNAIRQIDHNGSVTTIAGNGRPGYVDGQGRAALFDNPIGVAADQLGNIYIADRNNHVIRRIGSNGVVSTFAGNGTPGYINGPALQSQFDGPIGVATDAAGNVYVADSGNNAIRRITAAGSVESFAGGGYGGVADEPGFDLPAGIVMTEKGLVVADSGDGVVKLVGMDGSIKTLSGQAKAVGHTDGYPYQSMLYYPFAVAESADKSVLVVDAANNEIRSIENGTFITRTVAGTASAKGLQNGTALPRL